MQGKGRHIHINMPWVKEKGASLEEQEQSQWTMGKNARKECEDKKLGMDSEKASQEAKDEGGRKDILERMVSHERIKGSKL